MAVSRKEVEAKIVEKLGFVPDFYRSLPDSALSASWSLEDDLELSETALDRKTKQLVGLALASHIKCKYCIYFHTRGAVAFGASPQELREAVAMGGATAFFSNSITGAQTDFEQFKRDVDRFVEHLVSQKK